MEHTYPTSATGPAVSDPDAMVIDAARTGSEKSRIDFLRWLKGKCFRCGSTGHASAGCPNATEEKLCGYCKRPKHFKSVCQDKFMGLERNRGLKPARNQRMQEHAICSVDTSTDDEAQRKAAALDQIELKMKVLDAQRQELQELMKGFC